MGEVATDTQKPKLKKEPNYVRIIVTAVFLSLTFFVFTSEFQRLSTTGATYLSWDDFISVSEKDGDFQLFSVFRKEDFDADEFYRTQIVENYSCLIQGYAREWPAAQTWTKETIDDKLKDTRIMLKYHTNSLFADPAVLWKEMKFPDYMTSFEEKRSHEELRDVTMAIDMDMPDVLKEDLGTLPFANVLGEPEIKFFHSLNYREYHASYSEKERIFVCLADAISIYAVPASDWANVKPTRMRDGTIWSGEDIRRSVRKSTTKFGNVRERIAILLLKGDVMYMPSWWWVAIQTQKVTDGAALAVYEYPPSSRLTNLMMRILPEHFAESIDEQETERS